MRQACRHVISGDSYSDRVLFINHMLRNFQIHSISETQGDVFRSHFARDVMVWVFFCIVFISWFYFVRYPAVLMSCWVSLVPAVVLPLSWIKLHLLIFLLLPSPAFGSALFAPALGRQYILFRIKGNTTAGPGKLNRDTLQNKTGNKAAPKTQTMTHQTPKKKKNRFTKIWNKEKQPILEPDNFIFILKNEWNLLVMLSFPLAAAAAVPYFCVILNEWWCITAFPWNQNL